MRIQTQKIIHKNFNKIFNHVRKNSHCHNDFPLDLDDHKIKWSRHRSFLYGCDRSPGMHVLKLGTEIPNQERHNWSTKMV